MDALSLLHERYSCHGLQDPGPNAEQMAAILKAAVAVPDFQHLHPYEFLIAEGQGRVRLGALLEQAARHSAMAPAVIERAARMPLRAPTVIVVAAKYRPSDVVSEFEQQLSAGCAVMAMQQAAFAQGFRGVWRSGWPMFERHLHTLLGLGEKDRIVGFLYLGTAQPDQKIPVRPDPAPFCRRL